MTYSICFSPVGVDDFSQQLNKLRWSNKSHLHWVYGGLAVSRGTLFYAASRLAMCFTWNLGRGGWVVGDGFWELFFLPLLPRSWCFTWNRRIVGSSFWLLEECGSTSLSVIIRDCYFVIRFLWVYLLGVCFFGWASRRGFVLWLEWWGYWVGCRVSRETFCWIIGGLVELIQICLGNDWSLFSCWENLSTSTSGKSESNLAFLTHRG